MRIALLGDIGMPEDEARAALGRAADAAGASTPETVRYPNAIDLVDDITRTAGVGTCDILLCSLEAQGISGLQVASEIRGITADVRIVLIADDAARAFEASELDVNGFLLRPVAEADFVRTLTVQIREAALCRKDSVLIRFRDNPRRVRLTDILFSETSNHDQLVHLRGGGQESVRMSSQALFDLLSHDGRFFKLGSSFIVNLDEVAELRNGNAILVMVGGYSMAVPVRVRKSLEDALAP